VSETDTTGREVTSAWRLRCRVCGHTWRGRSAETGACPECEGWDIVSARGAALAGVDDA